MSRVDKRNRLDEHLFHYQVNKNNTIFVYWNGMHVTTLKGKEAQKFLAKIEATTDHKEAQLILAKITGNFKHGNER